MNGKRERKTDKHTDRTGGGIYRLRYGQTDRQAQCRTDGRTDRLIDGRTDRRMEGRIDLQMEGQTDGWMGRQKNR